GPGDARRTGSRLPHARAPALLRRPRRAVGVGAGREPGRSRAHRRGALGARRRRPSPRPSAGREPRRRRALDRTGARRRGGRGGARRRGDAVRARLPPPRERRPDARGEPRPRRRERPPGRRGRGCGALNSRPQSCTSRPTALSGRSALKNLLLAMGSLSVFAAAAVPAALGAGAGAPNIPVGVRVGHAYKLKKCSGYGEIWRINLTRGDRLQLDYGSKSGLPVQVVLYPPATTDANIENAG